MLFLVDSTEHLFFSFEFAKPFGTTKFLRSKYQYGSKFSQIGTPRFSLEGVVYRVLPHWGFLVPNPETGFSMTVRLNGPLFCISLGRFSRYRLNNMMGHLSLFPVANILGVTSLIFTLNPPCLILVGPSAKVRNSFPSVSRCKVKSPTFICWCSCRPRGPKC